MKLFESLTHALIPNTREASRSYRSRIGKFQGWVSISVNSLLFVIKVVIGLLVGSISILADAIHTFSDVISSGVVIWGFRQLDKPADVEHPYGHGRAEYIATLVIAVLLCVAGVEFIQASVRRIAQPAPIDPAWWMVIAVAATIVVKEITARYADFLSHKIASSTLRAEAWHHRSDAISSGLVVIALVAGRYGYASIDGWAGLGVALFVIWTGFQLAKGAVDDLIGRPPTEEEIEEIRHLVMPVEGVLGVHDVTVHSYGHDKFASVHVEIDAAESPSRAHDIAEEVEQVLQKAFQVEPTVHMDPVHPGNPKVQVVASFLETRQRDDERITDVHDIRMVETEKHNVILFGINVKPGLSRARVVECCQELETSLLKEFPGYEVNIKVSPLHRY